MRPRPAGIARSTSPPPNSTAAARTAVRDGDGQPRSRGKKYSPTPRANIPAQPNSWMCPCAWTAATHQSPADLPAGDAGRGACPGRSRAVRASPVAHQMNGDDGNRSSQIMARRGDRRTTSSSVIPPRGLDIVTSTHTPSTTPTRAQTVPFPVDRRRYRTFERSYLRPVSRVCAIASATRPIARICAARRGSTWCSAARRHTSPNARTIIVRRRRLISSQRPPQRPAILDPLEVAHCHPTVRWRGCPGIVTTPRSRRIASASGRVGRWRPRPGSSRAPRRRLAAATVLQGGRHQDVALESKQLRVRDRLRSGRTARDLVFLVVAGQPRRIEPVAPEDAPANVRDRDDPSARGAGSERRRCRRCRIPGSPRGRPTHPARSAGSLPRQIAAPRPVASERPSDPPSPTGLPVTTPCTE